MRHIADLMNFFYPFGKSYHNLLSLSIHIFNQILINCLCKASDFQKKPSLTDRMTTFLLLFFLNFWYIRLAGLRRESATAGSNKIKGRDRACCPVNRKKALPRELVTPLLSLVFYVLSFVEMILLRGSAKVNTFCRRKMPIFLPHFL